MTSLYKAIEGVSSNPLFVAGWVSAAPRAEKVLRDVVSDEQTWGRLLLCKSPRPQYFYDDVNAVSDYLNLDAIALAEAFREIASVESIRMSSSAPLVAAAREELEQRDALASVVQRNISRGLADQLQTAITAFPQHMDLARRLSMVLPLKIVQLASLSLSSASQWLNSRGVSYSIHQRDRELMGLLVAARGNGLVFLSAELETNEWAFTLLHEIGHFMLDHLIPRRHIVETEPRLLDVFDGDRRPTPRDHAISFLGGIDIGVHAHLLDRDDRGYASADTGQHEDQASDFALEFLAPMQSVLMFLRESLSQRWNRSAAVDEAASLLSFKYLLPSAVARLRAIEATRVLEIPNSIIDP